MTKKASPASRRALALAILTAAACAAAPSSSLASGAQTFCVHQGPYACPAGSTDEGSDLQSALNNAGANSVGADTPNVVDIGPGTYSAADGFDYVSANPIRIVGAGPGATTLTTGPDSASGTHVLSAGAGVSPLTYTAATVSGLTLAGVNANGFGLVLVNGAADHVTVTDNAAGATGLNLQYSTVKSGSVSVTDGSSTGALIQSGGSDELDDVAVSAGGFGISAGATTTLLRDSVDAGIGVEGTGGDVHIEDSLVRASTYGLVALDTAGQGSITAGNDTIVHADGGQAASSYGAYAQSVAGKGAHIGIVNSILHGFTFPFGTGAQSGSAAIDEGANNYDGTYLAGGVTTTQPIGGDPDFVDPAHGDYHLAAGSPLIDAVGLKYLSLSSTDLDGHPRVVTVNHASTPLDLGAYEYQPPASTTGGGNGGGGNGGGNGGGAPGTGTPGTGTPGTGTPGTGHQGSGNAGNGNASTSTPPRGSRPAKPLTVKLVPLGRLAIASNRLSLRLSCSGTAACTGIKATATAMRAHHRKVTVGSLSTRLAAGHKATLVLSLNRAGRSLLASRRRLAVTIVVTVRDGKRTRTVETIRTTLHRLP